MERKKGIILAFTMIFIMGVIGYCLSYGDLPRIPMATKGKIMQEYKRMMGEFYERFPLVWFDDNGGRRDEGVHRYFGTYGDCVVLLKYDREVLWHFPIFCTKKTTGSAGGSKKL